MTAAAIPDRALRAALVLALAAAAALPLVDAIGRPLGGFHVPGGSSWVQHATLWMAFLGGLVAAREGKHLTLSTAELLGEGRGRRAATFLSGSVAAAVTAVLAYASWDVVLADKAGGRVLPGGVPEWVSELVMPVGLAFTALRFVKGASPSWSGRAASLALALAPFLLGIRPEIGAKLVVPLAVVLLASTLVGSPVFVAMAGLALLLFFREAAPVSSVSVEVYRLISSATLPAIPLLTAAGYVLAEGESSKRLVRFFRALFGSLPGGVAVMVAAVCALFTTFTGGSGVTIIALGGLVYPILREEGYGEGFSLGLVTASGSLGLLFPPSLPVVLYSVVVQVPADKLYVAGLLPGLLLVVLVALWGVWNGMKIPKPVEPRRFSAKEAVAAAWHAKWELFLPVFIVGLFATGLASTVEVSAAALAYTVIVGVFVTRDVPLRAVPSVVLRSSALMGAVLLLLSTAMGLTGWLVDAQIPAAMLTWVRAHIESPMAFLLALNVILLVLGSVLEIYSAIVVLAPLLAPIAAAYGIDPVHLGVVFLANLELGFLFPPVGLNLFLSSSRFGVSLPKLYRHVVPYLVILGVGVLLITYVPSISVGLVGPPNPPAATAPR